MNCGWSECLPYVLHQYNTQEHSTTKHTPFEAFYGRTGTDLDFSKSRDELLSLHRVIQVAVRENSLKAAKRMVQRHMKKAKTINFEIGDIVLVKNPDGKDRKKDEPLYNYKGEIIMMYHNKVLIMMYLKI